MLGPGSHVLEHAACRRATPLVDPCFRRDDGEGGLADGLKT